MSWFGSTKAGERAKKARSGARRRARETAAGPPISPATRALVYAIRNGRCHLCKLPVSREDFHVEHIVALANGGTNELTNLAAAHPRCNTEKGARVGPKRKGLRRTPFRRKPRVVPDDVF